MKNASTIIACLICYGTCWARELHVSVKGNDAGPGTLGRPFRTIGHAALLAEPGDTITVHAGTYREQVNPPRGGVSDNMRILYRAAPGEMVEIKGSEIVKGWERVGEDIWKVTLPDSVFGAVNPYKELIYGDWYFGSALHTGAVYLNGEGSVEGNDSVADSPDRICSQYIFAS